MNVNYHFEDYYILILEYPLNTQINPLSYSLYIYEI